MVNDAWAVLVEAEGKVHVVEMSAGVRKVKGLGVFDPVDTIGSAPYGTVITLGQKQLTENAAPPPRTFQRNAPKGTKPSVPKTLATLSQNLELDRATVS